MYKLFFEKETRCFELWKYPDIHQEASKGKHIIECSEEWIIKTLLEKHKKGDVKPCLKSATK